MIRDRITPNVREGQGVTRQFSRLAVLRSGLFNQESLRKALGGMCPKLGLNAPVR